jgi:hypothetical protein
MQLKFHQSPHYSSLKMLQKSTSMPSFTDTTNSSSASIDATDEEHRKMAVKWILAYSKKVARDTQYLAVAYLHRLPPAIVFTEDNYERLAATLILVASKINEVYPPKISSLIARCQHITSKEELVELEGRVVAALDYDLALGHTPYSLLVQVLGALHAERLVECEKLLRMVTTNREIWSSGDETVAYAVVYLILPQFVKDMRLRTNQKVKALAITIYNLYQTSKEQYEREKENRGK